MATQCGWLLSCLLGVLHDIVFGVKLAFKNVITLLLPEIFLFYRIYVFHLDLTKNDTIWNSSGGGGLLATVFEVSAFVLIGVGIMESHAHVGPKARVGNDRSCITGHIAVVVPSNSFNSGLGNFIKHGSLTLLLVNDVLDGGLELGHIHRPGSTAHRCQRKVESFSFMAVGQIRWEHV